MVHNDYNHIIQEPNRDILICVWPLWSREHFHAHKTGIYCTACVRVCVCVHAFIFVCVPSINENDHGNVFKMTAKLSSGIFKELTQLCECCVAAPSTGTCESQNMPTFKGKALIIKYFGIFVAISRPS